MSNDCEEKNLDLGFVEECDSALLRNVYFPSKIGGKPAWLDLETMPTVDDLKCKKCGAPESFLCQVYAPIDDDPECFHRTIYLFICREPGCFTQNSSENLSAFRSQLPRQNKFYSAVPPNDDDRLPAVKPPCIICVVCGCQSSLMCSRCKNINYCSAKHQRAHWSQHKISCKSGNKLAPNEDINISLISFPEYEIIIQSEITSDLSEHCDDEAAEQRRQDEFQKLVDQGKAGTMNEIPESELSKYATEDDEKADVFFRTFKERTSKNPKQVLRYDLGGEPLWIADPTKTVGEIVVPPCTNCNGERQFEFQVMPQMINYLKDDNIDWGVLAVYTCKKSCHPSSKYLKEFIIKQDILPDDNK